MKLLLALLFAAQSLLPARGYFNDRTPEGMTSRAFQAEMETTLSDYEKRTSNEVAVLIVPSLNGLDVKEVANKTFHEWGIGKRTKNNGVLFLWSVGDRRVRIEVGYGLEQVLTDGTSGNILRTAVTPAFKQSRWEDGLRAGLVSIMSTIDTGTKRVEAAQPVAAVTVPAEDPNSLFPWVLGGIAVLIGGIFIAIFMTMQKRKREAEEAAEQAARERLRKADSYKVPYSRVKEIGTKKTFDDYLPPPPKKREEPRYIAPTTYEPPSTPTSSYSPSSFDSSSSSGSSFGGFGGGDSGGGGADSSY